MFLNNYAAYGENRERKRCEYIWIWFTCLYTIRHPISGVRYCLSGVYGLYYHVFPFGMIVVLSMRKCTWGLAPSNYFNSVTLCMSCRCLFKSRNLLFSACRLLLYIIFLCCLFCLLIRPFFLFWIVLYLSFQGLL